MTDYHHDHVVVYTALGGNLRLASTLRATVTDTLTGDPVNVTQGAITAPYVDVDTDGHVTFTATTPNRLRLTSGSTFVDVWPIEVSGPDDAGVATLIGTASATRTALDARYMQDGEAASGDLSGTYPSPTVAKINGVTVSGTPSAGHVLQATSASAAAWGAFDVAAAAYTPTLTADVTPPTLGTGGSASARVLVLGDLVALWFEVLFGTDATAGSGVYGLSLPYAAAATGLNVPTGQARAFGPSSTYAPLECRITTPYTHVMFQYPATWLGTITNVGAAAPWTWASGHRLGGFVIYERAS